MPAVKMMDKAQIREFRRTIRPMLEAGQGLVEVADALNKSGFKMPDGRPVHPSTVGRHKLAMGIRSRKKKRTRRTKERMREARTGIPVSGALGLVTDLLTVPGLSEKDRLRLVTRALGKA